MRTTRRHAVAAVIAMAAAMIAAATTSASAATRSSSSSHKPEVTSVEYQGFASSGTTGGARVTVRGHHFDHVRSVRFGHRAGSKVSVGSATELKVTAPAHPLGQVHVRVVTTAGSSETSADNAYDFQVRQRLAGGESHACQAVKKTRTVRCWGDNTYGELGDSSNEDSTDVPVAVPDLTDAVAVAAGENDSCALLASGDVQCWGANDRGQLGHGDRLDWDFPVPVRGLPKPALEITAGVAHTCAVLVGGTVSCWGDNTDGELGDGSTTESLSPVPVAHLRSVVSVSAGGDSTCAARSNGHEFCWGYNDHGQLGDGSTTSSSVPVATVRVSKAAATATNGVTSCALTDAGTVRCWGYGGDGELGDGHKRSSSTPVTVSGLKHATQLALGGASGCAVAAGRERCWGVDSSGQLGNGTTTDTDVPVKVKQLTGVTDIACGDFFALATLSSGATEAWGDNFSGTLGNGTTNDSDVPVPVH